MLTHLQKNLLRSFIAFLVLTALVAIWSVLSGEFGDTQMRVLATTFTISAASICAMACAVYGARPGRLEAGAVGVAAAVIASALVIIGIWADVLGNTYWKATFTAIIISVGLAYAFLLLLAHLSGGFRIAQIVAVFFIALLAGELIFAIWAEVTDPNYYRLVAVVSIVTVLFTLIVPIGLRFQPAGSDSRQKMLLTRVNGDTYRDATGKRYRVTEI